MWAFVPGHVQAAPSSSHRTLTARAPELTVRVVLDQHGTVTAQDVARAASLGDPVAVELLVSAGRRIGSMLAGVVNFFNPSPDRDRVRRGEQP